MPAPEADPYLVVENLTVQFPTHDGLVQAVSDLSYTVRSGQTLGIVGESGSGKSVSSMAVLGLHNPHSTRLSGSIRVGGTEVIGADKDTMRGLRGNDVVDDLPGPAHRAAPVLHDREADQRGRADAQQGVQGRRPSACHRDARPRRHPAGLSPGRRLPAPVLRRHAAARDDRDGAGQQPAAAHRRRADHRARRDRPGPDPRPAPGPAARVRLGHRADHPRPRRHRRDRRRRAGDVRRPGGRERTDEDDPDPAGDALHLGTPEQRARHHRRHRCPADPHPGHAAEPAQPARGLRVPPALPALREGARRPVPDHPARARAGQRRRATSSGATWSIPTRSTSRRSCPKRLPTCSTRRPGRSIPELQEQIDGDPGRARHDGHVDRATEHRPWQAARPCSRSATW